MSEGNSSVFFGDASSRFHHVMNCPCIHVVSDCRGPEVGICLD